MIPLIAGGLGMALFFVSGKTPVPVFTKSGQVERLWVSGTAAVVMFAGCWLAGGGPGSGRMAYLGPNALFTALATFVLTYVGGLACDQLRRLRNWWSSRRALRSVDLREQSNDILDVGRHMG